MAITIPSVTPMIIDSTVRVSDVRTPSMTGGRNMLSNMKRHWNASLVTSMWTNMAATMARTTIATQRPGCRTGTAVMASGCARSAVFVSVMRAPGSAPSGIDGGVVDGARLDAPLLEDRLVGAVGDQRLDRVGGRLGELGLVLLDHVTVRRRVVDVTKQLELAVGLLDGVRQHGGVGQHGLVLARHDRGRRLALVLVAVDGDGRLAGALARLLSLGQVLGLLDGRGLDGDLLAAGVVGLDAGRVALLGPPLRAGIEVADHVDLLLALVVDGERRHAELVLAGLPLGLQAELGRDRVEQVDVPANDRLAVGVQELVRRVFRVDPDQDLAVGLDLVRHLGGPRLVDRRGGPGRPGAPAAGVVLLAATRRHQGDHQPQTEERPVAPPACLHGFSSSFVPPSGSSVHDIRSCVAPSPACEMMPPMKPAAFEYHRPGTVAEALAVLAEAGHDGKVLAGGQSLVPLLNMRLAAPRHLVDVNWLAEL